MINLKRR